MSSPAQLPVEDDGNVLADISPNAVRRIHLVGVAGRFVTGGDYRLLVVGAKVVAAARRRPPTVTGDGSATVTRLVERVNEDPRRTGDHAEDGECIQRITPTRMLAADSVRIGGIACHRKSEAFPC